MKLVSILVRTCGRPLVLRQALESIRNQTYKNIEVVVVEDGGNAAEKLLKEEFSDLNVQYASNSDKKGRTITGNIALSMATGDYFNFLDDDDFILPNHVEILVNKMNNSEKLAAYAVAYESVVKYDKERNSFKEYKRWIRYRQPFNRCFLTFNNYIPIQSIMFSKKLYEQLGGFDETMDMLEDWELWVRYSTKTDFEFVDQITSVYRVPKVKKNREERFYNAYLIEIEKFKKYNVTMNYYEINRDVEYMLNYMKTSKWKRVLKDIKRKVIYKNSNN